LLRGCLVPGSVFRGIYEQLGWCHTTANRNKIRQLLDERTQAVRHKNVSASVAHLAPNAVSFDVVNPLQCSGVEGSRKRAEEWFSSFDGPIDYEIRDLSIVAAEDTAFAYGLSHLNATTNGGQLDMFWRSTFCFRKTDGQWHIVHEHDSVPFNVHTGKASLDLKP
jgi:ketosteroid isomerase-like protein